MPDLTPGFNGLSKGYCKTRRKAFQFWDSFLLILQVWLYTFVIIGWVTNPGCPHSWPNNVDISMTFDQTRISLTFSLTVNTLQSTLTISSSANFKVRVPCKKRNMVMQRLKQLKYFTSMVYEYVHHLRHHWFRYQLVAFFAWIQNPKQIWLFMVSPIFWRRLISIHLYLGLWQHCVADDKQAESMECIYTQWYCRPLICGHIWQGNV